MFNGLHTTPGSDNMLHYPTDGRTGSLHASALVVAASLFAFPGAGHVDAASLKKSTSAPAKATHSVNAPKKSVGTKPSSAPSKSNSPPAAKPKNRPAMTMDKFLDRLMIAESGGNNYARNARSTATGPYQFIESTFLSVLRRHFPKRVTNLTATQILALRTDRGLARDAARAYTRDNATYLTAAGHKPTFPHLRLAFLLGAGGAIRILDATPTTPLARLLSPNVIRANPWMTRYTARSLIARAARDVSLSPSSLAGAKPFRDPVTGKLIIPGRRVSRGPRIKVRCNLARPSCKRWLSLKRRSLARKSSKKHRNRSAKR